MPTTTALTWHFVDEGFEGGQSGGDAQMSDDFSLRLLPDSEPDDGLHGVITETWFVEDLDYFDSSREDDAEPARFGVTCRIEYLVCTDVEDPGGTEVSSTMEYDNDADIRIYSDLDTAKEAMYLAVRSSLSMPDAYTWDGRTCR